MNHSFTQKLGWTLSDDTVEVEFDDRDIGRDPADWPEALMAAVEDFKGDLYDVGVRIANQRNHAGRLEEDRG